jgi:Diaphanous FH3 Domain
MTAICKMAKGHSRVSEALTTLRLNMGEPVRMKLLTGIINSAASRVESLTESNKSSSSESTEPSLRFLVEAMAFLNAFVHSAPDLRNKVVIQWEVEEAALNIHALSKVTRLLVPCWLPSIHLTALSTHKCQVAETTRSPLALQLKQQLQVWAENQMDVSLLLDRLTNVTSTNEALRKDLHNLRSRLLVSWPFLLLPPLALR